MKNLILHKNGLFICNFIFNENSGKTLKRTCIELANVNVNSNYELKVTGELTRTFSNK
jgi:hypothetical protein